MSRTEDQYELYECKRSGPGEPKRYIELDADHTMYFTIEFAGNKDVVWNVLIAQADRCFRLLQDRIPNGMGMQSHERLYTLNGYGETNDILLANDYLEDTMSITARMPDSQRAINTFVATEPHLSGCADLMKQLIHMSLAEHAIEQEFQNPFE